MCCVARCSALFKQLDRCTWQDSIECEGAQEVVIAYAGSLTLINVDVYRGLVIIGGRENLLSGNRHRSVSVDDGLESETVRIDT